MCVGNAHIVKLAAVGINDHDACFAGLRSDVTECLVGFTLGDEYFIYTSSNP